MQTYETKSIDARSFPEIWETLQPAERSELKFAMIAKLRCTDVTFYNWAKGATMPVAYSAQRDIAGVIKSTLGLSVSPKFLFPAR
jgi:hypothetical protein